MPSIPAFLTMIFRWALNIALVIAVVWFLRKHWSTIRQWWAELWASLRRNQPLPTAEVSLAPPKARFADFQNPFASGQAGRMSPNQLVLYSYQALQAWSIDRRIQGIDGATPLELTAQLRLLRPDLAPVLEPLGNWVSQIAYARSTVPAEECSLLLQTLWRGLAAPPQPAVAPQPAGVGR